MKTIAFVFAALTTTTLLSANCPGGSCSYPGQGYGQPSYQNQGYGQSYQDRNYQNNNQYPQRSNNAQNSYQDRDGYYNNSNGNSQYNNVNDRNDRNYNDRNYNDRNPQYNNGNDRNPNDRGYFSPQNDRNYNDRNSNQYQNGTDRQYNERNSYNERNDRETYNDRNVNRDRSGNSSYENDRNAPRITKTPTDEEISKEVTDAIKGGWLSSGYPDVSFDVNNGTVNLRGNVKTLDEKTKLENTIRKVDGVRQINNQINLAEPSTNNSTQAISGSKRTPAYTDSNVHKTEASFPQDSAATDADRVINSKIRNNLNGWFTKGYDTVVISTSNGIVTITGFVEKDDDLQKINKEVKNVEGVKSVNNNASVQKK